MPDRTHQVILFKKCTGYNDSQYSHDVRYDLEGNTDIIGCENMTTTPDGKLVKVPALQAIANSVSDIDEVTAGSRLFIQAGTALVEYNGTAVVPLAASPPVVAGSRAKYIHTPIDTRVAISTGVQYKIPAATSTAVALTLGTYAGPPVNVPFAKMPDFSGGFVHGAKLYTHAGKFLQYSEDYAYDLWNLGDGFIGHQYTVTASGQIPGCVIAMHVNGVTAYLGTGPHDFQKKFFPCLPLAGTLFSGFVSKLYDSAHVFLCNDGVYVLTADGKLSNATLANTTRLSLLNTAYNTVVLVGGKYLAFGNSKCVEFDFVTKAMTLRDTAGITASCLWNDAAYFGSGKVFGKFNAADNEGLLNCKVQLPYNDCGTDENKHIRFVYLTGYIGGDAAVTVYNQDGVSVTTDISDLGYVRNYKVTGLRQCKGNKLSLEFTSTSGIFKLEEVRATFVNCSSRR